MNSEPGKEENRRASTVAPGCSVSEERGSSRRALAERIESNRLLAWAPVDWAKSPLL